MLQTAKYRPPLSPLSLCLAFVLSACSFQQQPEAMVPEHAEVPATTPVPIDSLYALLAAELAGHRGRIDITLTNYLQQARQTRDPGVARQAALMARQLQAGPLAAEAATLWADIEPSSAEAQFLACQYAIAAQEPERALVLNTKLLALNSETLFTPLAMSLRPATEDTRAGYEKKLRALYSQHENSDDLLLAIAVLLEQQTRYAESLVLVRKAQKIDKDSITPRLYEVDLLYRIGKPEQAIKHMARIVTDHQDNDRLRLQYARMLSDQDLGKASEQFEILAQDKPLDSDLLLARGLVNFQLEDRKQARNRFEELLFLKKHVDTAHYYLGELDLAEDKTQSALEHFLRVQAGSEYLPAVAQAFRLMIDQGKRLEGQKWLADERRTHPDLEDKLYLTEADVLLQQDDLPRSLTALDAAIKQNPSNIDAYYTRSLLHEKMDNVSGAENDLRFVLNARPGNPDVMNALGYLLADRTTRYDEAFLLISQALALKPDDPAIIDSMGWVLYRQGQLDEAELRLQHAFSLYKIDEVAAHLGEVLWVKGDKKQATRVWNDGLKLNPDSEFIRKTRQRLETP